MKPLMKPRYLLAFVFGISVFAQSYAQAAEQQKAPAAAVAAKPNAMVGAAEAAEANATCNVNANEQQCCSAAGCTGKVLSNRDAHNCKVKSTGKSWHPASVNGNPAACSRM